MSTIANIIWIIFGGLVTAIAWCFAGLVFSITIIGIPRGRQCFKMASLTLPMAISYAVLGVLYCITVIGIPIGLQCLKMAKLSLLPFGAQVR